MKKQSKPISFSLNKKLIVLVLAVSLVALTVTATLSFGFADSILKENINKQLVNEAVTRGDAVESLINKRIQQVESISEIPLIRQYLIDTNTISDENELNTKIIQKQVPISVELRNFQLEHTTLELDNVEIISREGKVLFSLEDPSKITTFSNDDDLKGIVPSSLKFVPAQTVGDRKMAIYTPILLRNDTSFENIGTLVTTTGTSALDRILLSRYQLEETGEVYMVNEDRVMISDSIFIENAALNQKVNTFPVKACFERGESVNGVVYPDYRGLDIFGISYCLKEKGFVVLTEIDEAEVLLPLVSLQHNITLLGVAIVAGVSTITLFLSKRISKPITKLRDAANEIAKGNFEVATKIKSNDEIGELSSAFDYMAKRLKESAMAINLREEIIKQQEDILLRFSKDSEQSCVCLVDIIQSTMITAELSEDKTRQFYSIFINFIANIVKNFDGIVAKNIGDALLFYFPKIKADDKEGFKNVMDCCLTIAESHEKLNQEMEKEGLPPLAYRTSVTYGPVNLAKVLTSSVRDIFGSTVNRCAKINRFALPNTVVIGSDIYENIKSFSEYSFRNMNVNPAATKQVFTVYLVSRKNRKI